MAETFASNGGTAAGYLVVPPTGSGPGVVVVQEWWGLDPGILEMAERLGQAGFVALVPDLYHGEICGHTEMDKAAHLMSTLPPDRAARDMSGAVDCLLAHPAVTGEGIGVVGFCMGGMQLPPRPARLKPVPATGQEAPRMSTTKTSVSVPAMPADGWPLAP